MRRIQKTNSCDPKQDALLFHNETQETISGDALCSRCTHLKTHNYMTTEMHKTSKPSDKEKLVTFNCKNSKNRCGNKGTGKNREKTIIQSTMHQIRFMTANYLFRAFLNIRLLNHGCLWAILQCGKRTINLSIYQIVA